MTRTTTNTLLARGLAEGVVEALMQPTLRLSDDEPTAAVSDDGAIAVHSGIRVMSDISPEQAPVVIEALTQRFAEMLAGLPEATTMEELIPLMHEHVAAALAELA